MLSWKSHTQRHIANSLTRTRPFVEQVFRLAAAFVTRVSGGQRCVFGRLMAHAGGHDPMWSMWKSPEQRLLKANLIHSGSQLQEETAPFLLTVKSLNGLSLRQIALPKDDAGSRATSRVSCAGMKCSLPRTSSFPPRSPRVTLLTRHHMFCVSTS